MAVEEPKFEVLAQDGNYEIRKYGAVIIAETLVQGDIGAASEKGFRLIADYIFGNNQAPASVPPAAAEQKSSEKIAMTAPVVAEPVAGSSKIAMTAPVTVEPAADALSIQTASQWRIHFVMPSQYTLASLPKPKNEAVKLRELPPATFAVLSYSGLNTTSRVQEKTEELQRWMASKNIEPLGPPQLARYDPPWTLPMWRRNEIKIEIRRP
ncbi:MAG: SOUL family heme-binding protein [Polaromonas sp.]